MADSFESQSRAKSSFRIPKSIQLGITVKLVLAAYLGIFVLQYGLAQFKEIHLDRTFSLSLDSIARQPWSLFTSFLFHATEAPFHFFTVMVALAFVSPELERKLGWKLFLALLFAGAMGGGLAHLAVTEALGKTDLRTIGSAGAVYGLLWAYYCFFPESRFLSLPRGKVLVLILALMIFVSGWGWGDVKGAFEYRAQVAGGFAAAGFLLLVPRFSRLQSRLETRRQIREIVRDSELIAEVDDLLKKISGEGMESLTRAERRTLQRASQRFKRLVDRDEQEPEPPPS